MDSEGIAPKHSLSILWVFHQNFKALKNKRKVKIAMVTLENLYFLWEWAGELSGLHHSHGGKGKVCITFICPWMLYPFFPPFLGNLDELSQKEETISPWI